MSSMLQQKFQDYPLSLARRRMVESQIRPNYICDERILDAMGSLPREQFVPDFLSGIAYSDASLEVAEKRFLLDPMTIARLLQESGVEAGCRILDVGMATGYSSAILALMGAEVVALESDPSLMKQAQAVLCRLGLDSRIRFERGPLAAGTPSLAPFDLIFLNGGVETVPENLLRQLGEGGRLVAVIRQYGPAHIAHTGEARRHIKIRGDIFLQPLFNANVKRLPGFDLDRAFVL